MVTPDSGQSREYGDANPVLTYVLSRTTTGATGAALVNGNTLTGALASAADGTSTVGNYAITQGDLAASGNYTLSVTSDRTMAVTPRLITVRANDLMRDGGRPNPPLTYTISSGSLVSGDAFTGGLLTEAGSLSQAGNYTISRGSLSLGPNYSITFLAGIMTVLPETQAVLPETRAVLPETLTVLPETLTVLPEKQTARLPMQMDPGNSASALVSQMDLTRQAELLQSADDVSKITPPNWGNGQ
jgi:hypothetical protein